MNVALSALEAVIHVKGPKAERDIPIGEFFIEPRNTPHIENVLEPGDLVTHVTLPPPRSQGKQIYLKLRDRASYEFALASAAIVIETTGRKISYTRVALGGVGTRPWRSPEAEKALIGQPSETATFRKAAEAALQGARPQSENGFKVELAKRCIVHALNLATQSA
jgi:xanthine dehydrogenase YagS FAD-binding subunit